MYLSDSEFKKIVESAIALENAFHNIESCTVKTYNEAQLILRDALGDTLGHSIALYFCGYGFDEAVRRVKNNIRDSAVDVLIDKIVEGEGG